MAKTRKHYWPRVRRRGLSDSQLRAIHAKGLSYTKTRDAAFKKPHMTFNPGTGKMEPEDYARYQRQAPTHVFPKKESKSGLTKPIEFTPRKLHEMAVRAGQKFGTLPIRSSSGRWYFPISKEKQKKIHRAIVARESKIQKQLAKRSRTFHPTESNIEVPAGKLRIERVALPNVGENIKYDPQEVITSNPKASSRSLLSRDRWKEAIEARKKYGFKFSGRAPLKSGISTSDVGASVKSMGKTVRDPKEKETVRLRKKALRMHIQQLQQRINASKKKQKLNERRAEKRVKAIRAAQQKQKKKSRLRTFFSKIISLPSGRRSHTYYKELDDPQYSKRYRRS